MNVKELRHFGLMAAVEGRPAVLSKVLPHLDDLATTNDGFHSSSCVVTPATGGAASGLVLGGGGGPLAILVARIGYLTLLHRCHCVEGAGDAGGLARIRGGVT
jgi:hypothetical protein